MNEQSMHFLRRQATLLCTGRKPALNVDLGSRRRRRPAIRSLAQRRHDG